MENNLNNDESFKKHQEKINLVISKLDTSKLSENELKKLEIKVSEKIFQEEVNKSFLKFFERFEKLPKEEQDAFLGKINK